MSGVDEGRVYARVAATALALVVTCLGSVAAAQQASSPQTAVRPREPGRWRLHEAVGAPRWLRFGIEHRSRFEYVRGDFRTGAPSETAAYLMRTLVTAGLRLRAFTANVELQDSRAYATEHAPLSTSIVNAFELLQAAAGLEAEGVLARGDSAAIRIGRFTIDLGSRRLVARNDFRNTINAFSGIDAQWTSASGATGRAFAVVPVQRLPTGAQDLSHNAVEFDQENFATQLFGVFFFTGPLRERYGIEAYVLALNERDSQLVQTADRRLGTAGLRFLRAPAPGAIDLQVEIMSQAGLSRASAATSDTTDLQHTAFSSNVTLGYTAPLSFRPRFVVAHDFATGNGPAGSSVNQRFDPLFGARRFEFGPTSLWGAMARINLQSPMIRFDVAPHRTFEAMISYRPFWLASPNDAWTAAGLLDRTGRSGTFVGHQIEARVRWSPFVGNLVVELGGALLAYGDFAQRSSSVRTEMPLYVYTSVTSTL